MPSNKSIVVYSFFLIILLLAVGLFHFNARENPLKDDVRADRILVEKGARRLTLFYENKALKTYRFSLGGNPIGHKKEEGDQRTPEGSYLIDRRNPKSSYHLALHISYPNEVDAAQARSRGVSPGGDIMIHGIRNGLGWIGKLHRYTDWTQGCIALTNTEIEEIWRAVPDGTPIIIEP